MLHITPPIPRTGEADAQTTAHAEPMTNPEVAARWPAFRLASVCPGWLRSAWLWLMGGRTIPLGLRELLAFEPGERVLTVGRSPEHEPLLVATDRALYHHGDTGWPRLGWEQIAAVRWDEATGQLIVGCLPGTTPRRTVVLLPGPGTVQELAAERITHTRLGRWTLPFDEGRVQVEARRTPGTGELLWHITPTGGQPDLADDGLRRKIEAAIAQLVLASGITG